MLAHRLLDDEVSHMSYRSIDAIQEALSSTVFSKKDDARKAAGRALGTLLELIGFYLLNDAGLVTNMAIERPLAEYANSEITHNVEFSLHKSKLIGHLSLCEPGVNSITPKRILRELGISHDSQCKIKSYNPYASGIVRNASTVLESRERFINAYCNINKKEVDVYELKIDPVAMVECKRVGVEKGMNKGPQTIEKAKQAAYVSRSVSRLQRFRGSDGSILGVIENPSGELVSGPYEKMLKDIVARGTVDEKRGVVLTIGIVSDHGNWYSSSRMNKELKVLSQSYDWLLFLTDAGFTQFINETLFSEDLATTPIREAFFNCYGGVKKGSRFTKVMLPADADLALREYFATRREEIRSWFNVLTPTDGTFEELFAELRLLVN